MEPRGKKAGGGRRPRRMRAAPGPHEATLTVEAGGSARGRRRLAAVEAALRPEISGGAAGPPVVAGDSVTMRRLRGGRAIEIRVRSRSLASLRASLNAHMRMAALAADVAAVASGEEE
ncbi:MAG TPA: hypothetical protein VGB42_10410 [Candidatus Thermoplasmatota archaeon]